MHTIYRTTGEFYRMATPKEVHGNDDCPLDRDEHCEFCEGEYVSAMEEEEFELQRRYEEKGYDIMETTEIDYDPTWNAVKFVCRLVKY